VHYVELEVKGIGGVSDPVLRMRYDTLLAGASLEMIYCRDVVKRYGDVLAIDRVTLDVRPGISALVGPNGAGKSTLLKLLSGLLPLDTGEIRIDGLDIAEQPVEVKKRIGVVPEDLGLFDLLTLGEQLELSGRIYGLSVREVRQRASSLLRRFDLEDAQHLMVNQYSYGMRKKAALALALIHNPRVLVLDEPFEGLDPVSSRLLEELFLTLAQRGVTIFFASHLLPSIQRIASFVAMIRDGRIVWTSACRNEEQSLEKLYFDFAEAPRSEDLPWLGS
jgi:ABC-2 type transport system ATP-binding protein